VYKVLVSLYYKYEQRDSRMPVLVVQQHRVRATVSASVKIGVGFGMPVPENDYTKDARIATDG